MKTETSEAAWHVYMLVCRDGSIYTGVTTDVDRRVRQHNEGTGARYTRSRRPVWLAFTEPCGGRGDALRRELALKALTHDEKRLMILAAEAPPRHVGKQPFPRTLKVRGGRPDR